MRRRRAGRASEELAAARTEVARRQRFIDALLEAIDVGIVSCDADGTFVVSNRTERAMFGLDDGLGGKPMDYLGPRIDVYDRHGRRLPVEEYPLMRALRGEDVSRLEVLAGPAGGPHRELQVRARQILAEDGEVIGAVAALADVTAERSATRELAGERRRLLEAQRLGHIGSFEHEFLTGSWTFSEHLGVLWGLAPALLGTQAMLHLVVDKDRQALAATWRAALSQGGAHATEVRIHRADDHIERILRISIEVELDGLGRPVRARGTHLDMTDLTAAEAEARRANGFLNAVLTATPDLTFVADVSTNAVIYGSPGQEILGLDSTRLSLIGLDGLLEMIHPEDRPHLVEAIFEATTIADGKTVSAQYRGRHPSGAWRWLSHHITPFSRDQDHQVSEILSVVRDVTEVVDAHQALLHAASHDYLTGLPNRAQLVELLDAALDRSRDEDHEITVLFCDLDSFKTVNDTGGHTAGDAVLVESARRLVAAARDKEMVARVGGDEFVILVEEPARGRTGPGTRHASTSAPERAIGIAQRVKEVLSRPICVNGAEYTITVSIGIAYVPVHGPDASGPVSAHQVLHHADLAMYEAKQHGKNDYVVFNTDTLPRAAADPCPTRRPLLGDERRDLTAQLYFDSCPPAVTKQTG